MTTSTSTHTSPRTSPSPPAPAGETTFQRVLEWWPLLLWPVGIILVIIGDRMGWDWLLSKYNLEVLGQALIALAAGIFLGRARATGDPLRLILGVFAFALLCREIHFPGTGVGVYIALAACCVWAWAWRHRLAPLWNRQPVSTWFLCAVIAYALSQLVAQRFMLFLPREAELHVFYEEVSENVAHIILLVAALKR
jgi:hypothetical protein